MQYMVRVEIHRADRETYDRLHSAMEAESFIRTLTAEGSGKKYKMPIGAYWVESANDRWTVLEAAKRAALRIDPTAEIVVSGGGQIVFFNCPDEVVEHPLAAMLGMYPALSSTKSTYGSLLGLVPEQPAKEFNFMSALLGPPYKG
jgi:hypothetical protein